ncbi:YbhB/YbcL family Raf kinase inhibitor-like protein [Actinobacteria bacterium YIM 96077]|uniref:YbhB/YbcL family Raf kinase inhibitor-like protein n=1 Tax=Phytoactinopolyspora halophila TaxID=1981511 RepID=A0A329QVR9_9ACTN|nr:YbhB/YbcL family Raf kinase inhibitor-like protein [Phytoactinopolyspora halophila]AYY14266.1 YbhB/YbcL family Raf kinase inhibitor-like protein [Actinobacteria bacterium YIM 96077]RAW14808.1 YbhB/YbcL family Raf kinase inhibitor-like protein [Phytoactinopolyspora halophila]
MGLNIKDLKITSPDIGADGQLADRHANDRDNTPPVLHISGVPQGTAELAIICHDPDAPLPWGFTHWTLYGIPAETAEIGADADTRFRPGPNNFGRTGYGGPQPPAGHGPHRYYFWVYALHRAVEGEPSMREFLEKYADAIIEQNRVVGVYER